VDVLAGLLQGPCARGATVFRSVLAAPWALRIDDDATLGVVTAVRGDAWLVTGRGDPVHVRAGDVALLHDVGAYTVADDVATPPQVVVHPEARWSPAGAPGEVAPLSRRPWGRDRVGSTVLLVGAYHSDGELSRRLLDALPPRLVVSARELDSPFVTLLDAEVTSGAPGQDAVLQRLLDLVVIRSVRTWFLRPEADPPAWYAAYADPMVAAALRLLHADPARAWSVESLADEVGGTRTTLARRFVDRVGEAPMGYLARWRLSLAADLLRATDDGLAAVAREVGYGTVYSLSTAFKRVHGINPSHHRKAGKAEDAAKAERARAVGRGAEPPAPAQAQARAAQTV